MANQPYIAYSKEELDKIGNSIIYLMKGIGVLSKTKILKLLYVLDEMSISKYGIPFFNLKYKVWKFGPVSEEIFIDLSSDMTFLDDYIQKTDDNLHFYSKAEFTDDEFSDQDIELLDFVIENFRDLSAKELVKYTHRPNSPWYITAKENNVLELLESEVINNTEILVDMTSLIKDNPFKMDVYNDYLEIN